MFDYTVSRHFTAGTLAGLTIEQTFRSYRKYTVGQTYKVARPIGGSPYIDTILSRSAEPEAYYSTKLIEQTV